MGYAVSTMLIRERRELNAIVSACQKAINMPFYQTNPHMQDPYKYIIEKTNEAGKMGDFGQGKDATDDKHPVQLRLVGGEIDSLYTALKDAYNEDRRETIYKDLGVNLVKHIKGQHELNKSQQRKRPTIDLPETDASPGHDGLG